MTAEIVDGRKIAKGIREKISNEVKNIKSKYGYGPNISTIRIGSYPESDLYLSLRDKACNEVEINSNHIEFPGDTSEKEVLNSINQLNKDNEVHGILIQFPIPDHISQEKLINAIDPVKDVEGLTPFNMGKTLSGDEHIVPITPLSVLTILEHEKTDFQGKDVVIINHSNLVGKPLAALLLNRNASVSICHVFTKDLKLYSKNADVLITGAGVPKLIRKDHVKNDAFIVSCSAFFNNFGDL